MAQNHNIATPPKHLSFIPTMITQFLSKINRPHVLAAVIGLSALLAGPGAAQITPVGGIARNFTLTNRANGQPINLTDFAGQVLVLDFFAYWCDPCQTSSPDVETNIKNYYAARSGNAFGVPVQVLAVNIEPANPALTDAFVASAGLELVGNDTNTTAGAWSQFNETNGIPLFAILNCVAGSPSHAQWKVLYKQAGYAGATTLRGYIDTVRPSVTTPEIAVEQPVGTNLSDGSASISFGSVGLGSKSSDFTFTIKNTGAGNLTGLAITKNGANPVDFTVTSSPVAPVAGPSGTTVFTVQFAPVAAGSRSAVIHIASNDSDENPFDINLTGTGLLTAIQTWRQTHFGTASNTGNAADTADPYRTGIPNLLVFGFAGPNQNPVSAKASQLPQMQETGGNLLYSFTQPAGVSGVTYGAEWSQTLRSENWTSVPDTGTFQQHIFSVPIGTNPKIFMRLKVTNP